MPSITTIPDVVPNVDRTYGSDFSTFTTNEDGDQDLDPYFAEIFGEDLLREHVLRRWVMQRGEMWDAPDQGFDTRDQVSARFDPAGRKGFAVGSAMELEAEDDERIQSCALDLVQNLRTRELTVTAEVTPVVGEPFTLVASIDQVDVELLSP